MASGSPSPGRDPAQCVHIGSYKLQGWLWFWHSCCLLESVPIIPGLTVCLPMAQKARQVTNPSQGWERQGSALVFSTGKKSPEASVHFWVPKCKKDEGKRKACQDLQSPCVPREQAREEHVSGDERCPFCASFWFPLWCHCLERPAPSLSLPPQSRLAPS